MPTINSAFLSTLALLFMFTPLVDARAGSEDIAELIAKLGDKTTADEAGNELFAIGGAALPYLLDALSSSDARVRRGAITIFSGILSFNPDAMIQIRSDPDRILRFVTILLGALADADADVRSNAALSLATVIALATPEYSNNNVAPRLLEALQDKDERVRVGVANTIATLTGPHVIRIKQLNKALTDESPEVRERVAWAIWKQIPERTGLPCPDCADAIPNLRTLLEDPDRNVRHTAAVAIAAIDPNAYDAIPVLLDAVGIEARQEASLGFALKALKRMDENSDQSIVPILGGFLDHRDHGMRRAAEISIKFIKGE